MAAKRDFYEVLGVKKDAAEAELKKAYRKLAKNIIRTATRGMRRRSSASRKLRKHTKF